MNNTCDVSVILPALNEEETIGICIQKIKDVYSKNGIAGEILVVDSSTDNTPFIAKELGATVIHPDYKGYGNAYLAGFAEARGKIIVIGDADNTYDFSSLVSLITPVRQGEADMVIGSRLSGTILPGAMPRLHQYIGNPLLTFLLNATFHTRYSDTHSGYRAISRDALFRLSLHTGGMEFASEMMIEAARKKIRVSEIPITYYPRAGPSKLHSFADGWRHIRFIILLRPLPYLLVPGGLFVLLGVMIMISLLFVRNIDEYPFHSLILAGLFLTGGVQCVMTGMAMKMYAISQGYDTRCGIIGRLIDYHSLEILLGISFLFIVVGFLSGVQVIFQWIHAEFGTLNEVSTAIISLCGIVIGLQVLFSTILISMMLLKEDMKRA
ncbi:MAG: glycosyltransferase [Methanospirillaceae archaeon]|nr:glycosyltransferase [Methanospirillaceae archaeon]